MSMETLTISQILNRRDRFKSKVLNDSDARNMAEQFDTSLRITSATSQQNVDAFMEELSAKQAEFMEFSATALDIHDEFINLQELIENFNFKHGVDKLRRRQSALNRKIQYLNHLRGYRRGVNNKPIDLEHHKAMLSETTRYTDANVPMFTEEMTKRLDEAIATFERQIQNISDEVSRINQTHTREVDLSFMDKI